MTIKCLRRPRLQSLMEANQTLLTGTRSCLSPQPSLTVQAIGCMQIPKVIQIFRRNQSASDGCLLIEMPSPRCRGGEETDLSVWRKEDVQKVRLARVLRQKTTMTFGAVAERLQMGTADHLSHRWIWDAKQNRRRRAENECPDTKVRPRRSRPRMLLSQVFGGKVVA